MGQPSADDNPVISGWRPAAGGWRLAPALARRTGSAPDEGDRQSDPVVLGAIRRDDHHVECPRAVDALDAGHLDVGGG
jgi:hypothetical protein